VIQVRSRAAWAAATYSASALDCATVDCLELTQCIGVPASVNTMPVVERRESGQWAQSKSENAYMSGGVVELGSDEYVRPRSRTPCR
jgi:hypothetical protein